MATTNQPLIWDFYRSVPNATDVCGVVHYFDEEAQSLYLDQTTLATRTQNVDDGHWQENPIRDQEVITNGIFEIRSDHPTNGVLYFAAVTDRGLEFMRYQYMYDISNIISAWDMTMQEDSSISQLNVTVKNIDSELFNNDSSIFQPGAKMKFGVTFGNSQLYEMMVAYIDEIRMGTLLETIDISGRNTIGYRLHDQTMDDKTTLTGFSSDIIIELMDYAGVKDYFVQPGSGAQPFYPEPKDTIEDVIKEMQTFYSNSEQNWKMVELQTGKIIVGYDYYIAANFQANSYYTFDALEDIFEDKTTKLIDEAYTQLRVTGVDANDVDLIPVTVPVDNFKYWILGPHKTKHVEAPKGLTQEQLQTWAETQSVLYQYVGMVYEKKGPFRPQLLAGDIAEVEAGIYLGEALGIITEVTHSFDEKKGYRTDFSISSGGVATSEGDYVIYTRTAEANGYNRKQRLIDYFKLYKA